MCSIAGSPDYWKTQKMLETMKHRSPDGYKTIMTPKFSIGMGRLAIIDLKSPNLFPYMEDNLILSFNGEIYNYLELRKELIKKGHQFRTNSDTEVLLKSYKEWGLSMFDKLNGMFAFAIYDGYKIILARDIAGEKPLYYTEKPFQFASELKALDGDCKEFPRASYGIYNFKEFKIKPYWTLKKRDIDLRTAVDELDYLLGDSVRLRTRSDVPYGLYYSGGMDSTLISTYHDFKYKFTYRNKDYTKEFRKTFPKILWHLDYPTTHFSPFGFWKLAEEASKKVRVILSGEGGDELFGGYTRYLTPHFNYLAQQAFPSYKRQFSPAISVTEQGWEEFNDNMQVLLRIGDRMASAWGVENRCPFLDKRIIEFAYSLPDDWKIRGFQTKWILQELLKRRLPEYKQFEKTGLFCAVNKWIGVKDSYDKTQYMELQDKLMKLNV